MFYNYLLTALRSMVKSPLYSAINIFGLSVGLACCILFLAFLTYQFSFDTQFDGYKRIYQVTQTHTVNGSEDFTWSAVQRKDYDTIVANLPDIEQHLFLQGGLINVGVEDAQQENILYTDDAFFAVFDLPMVYESPGPLLTQPNQAVITESFAKKYFGNQSPVGKTLVLDKGALVVTDVMVNLPANTHLKINNIQVLVSLSGIPQPMKNAPTPGSAYLKLKEGASVDELNRQIDYLTGGEPPSGAANSGTSQSDTSQKADRATSANQRRPNTTLALQPLYLSHLASGNLSTGGSGNLFQNWYFIYATGGLAIGVLLISCFNFINLTTARFTQRNREIGLPK